MHGNERIATHQEQNAIVTDSILLKFLMKFHMNTVLSKYMNFQLARPQNELRHA